MCARTVRDVITNPQAFESCASATPTRTAAPGTTLTMFGCPPTVVGPDFSKTDWETATKSSRKGSTGAPPTWTTRTARATTGGPTSAPAFSSHQPLDVVVVMLGSNDLKACFGRTPDGHRGGTARLHRRRRRPRDRRWPRATIVLVSPVRIDDTAEWFEEISAGDFDPEIVSRSQRPHRRDPSRRAGAGCVVRRRGAGCPCRR